MFGDTGDEPENDRLQAIVPAYRFNCSGRVTEWKACVKPGGMSKEQYYIQFQVWRSTGTEGCYKLVDYNTPLDRNESVLNSVMTIGSKEFLIPKRGGAPDHCVVLPVIEERQIEFQSGDVIGYYVDYFKDGEDMDKGGIQWFEESEDAEGEESRPEKKESGPEKKESGPEEEESGVVVHYRDNLPREDIKSQYAIRISNMHPSACGFKISPEDMTSYSLSDTTPSAPIISFSIGK